MEAVTGGRRGGIGGRGGTREDDLSQSRPVEVQRLHSGLVSSHFTLLILRRMELAAQEPAHEGSTG